MAKKGEMARRSFARTAPKSKEKYLVENAKQLRENPFLILPECTEDRCKKYFNKLRKQLEKIHRFQDDIDKLEKLSHKRGLDGALAGTLLLALSEKAPYLAFLSFPTGDVAYAQRGKADKEKLMAMQHVDDPVYRLCGIKDLIVKKKLYVYSWDEGFVCTGKIAAPPKEFVEFIRSKLGFQSKNDVISCLHISAEDAKKKEYRHLNYLRIHWKSAPLTIAICENCAKSTKNTMFTLSKYMLQRNLSDDFDIEVVTQLIQHADATGKQGIAHLREYLSGELTDDAFIQKNAKSQEEHVQQSEEKILVLDGVSYGSDVHRFLDALQPNTYERAALEFILQRTEEPLVVSRISPNNILEMYWEKHGKAFIDSLVEDANMADSFFKLDENPSNILTVVFEYKQRQKILSQLPQYESLPPLASFADGVARTYRTFREKSAFAEIKKHPETPKGKSLAYAFLLAFGRGTETKWKYSKEEIEYGEFLTPYARALLDATPDTYSRALQELLTASGSSEIIPQ